MKKWIIGAVVVIVLAAAAWYFYDQKMAEASLVTDENAVLVADQQPGDETVVSYAKLSKPGYVVVYSTEANGTKTVLGSSDLLTAGEHRNVKVRHTGGTSINGSVVTATIVADDGDGSYSAETDTEVVSEDSAAVSNDAELDTMMSDEDLAVMLDEAGYDVSAEMSEDTMVEDDTMMSDEETMESSDEEMMEDETAPAMEDTTSSTVEVQVEGEAEMMQ
ncbi:hypothetical protein KKH15_01905 [Patescibacteria group bacterium]|nr:hypothetical protein [Patescibacteria group bacterium]MBU1755106.1 hypothetical protein [Patescibacteria group bacterium]